MMLDRPVWYCACHWSPAKVLPISHGLPCQIIQTIVFQIHYLLIHTAISHLVFKNIMGSNVKSFAKVEINNVYCSTSIHKPNNSVIKYKKVGQV